MNKFKVRIKPRYQSGTAWNIGFLIFLLACIIGWVANIIQIFGMVSAPVTGMILFKIAGILFFPVGIILGWMGM